MENKTPPEGSIMVKFGPPTKLTLTIIDELDGLGSMIAIHLACKVCIDEYQHGSARPVDKQNLDAVYAILNDLDKHAVDSQMAHLRANPHLIKQAIEQNSKQ